MNEIDEIVVTGGRPLHGTVRIQGSKNTALPVMAAALLSSGTSVLRECPKITDVFLMEKILRELGAETWWEDHDLYLDCSHADGTVIPEYFSGKMRSSVILLGAMLGRNGKARTGYPGGCVIGKRPVDLHIQVLQKLGARIVENGNEIQATCGKLKGAEVIFPKSSVGATEQGILAAVLAEGKTVFTGCAREPEITWLCQYLTGMGAKIEILENKPQLFSTEICKLCSMQHRDILFLYIDMTAGDGINRGNAVQQGGFARAGSTHDAEKFSFANRKRNVVDGFCQVAFVTVKFLDVIHP